jgi:hypothetical protein
VPAEVDHADVVKAVEDKLHREGREEEREDLLRHEHPALVKVVADAGHPVDSQLLHEAIDLPRRDAIHIRLEHDRDDRPLRAPPRLHKAREIRAARPLLGDQQLDLADPRLPPPGSIPIAMRHPRARRDLAKFRPNLRGDLRLHQLPRDQRDRLPDEVLSVSACWAAGR